jgi:quinohemoprotein ethanol dehydrogenase
MNRTLTGTVAAALSTAIAILVSPAPIAVAAYSRCPGEACARDGENWPGFGRTYDAQHYSPLQQIDKQSVKKLGLVWSADLNVPYSVSAPLAVDGTLYVAVGYTIVQAFQAATGKPLWRYDPKVAEVGGERVRAPTWGTHGLAYWHGRLFVGTKDGRLISLDARTGKPLWSVMTLDPDVTGSLSGPPVIYKDKVIIGFSGDVGTPRGYVTSFDAATGRRLWRFYTVPGDPAKGFENPAMAMAAKTWTGEWWKFGGGGTVWNAITYDAESNRLYIGTGNGNPWNRKVRSPGGGDNLFVASVVALDADTGAYIWHYQTSPGDTWDFDSANDIELATLQLDGKPRKVILHAAKNGFFYVIDRETGRLISAEKFAKASWADHIDLATGRPVETPNARYQSGEETVYAGPVGAHSWLPMSFNPGTGLVYIPAIELAGYYNDKLIDPTTWKPAQGVHGSTALSLSNGSAPPDAGSSSLVAWDPVAQKPRWVVPLPGFWNGGTLTTAGNLVFQGRTDGSFVAYDAVDGAVLWSMTVGAPVTAPPITYRAQGKQYVTVLTGIAGGGTAGTTATLKMGWDFRTYRRQVLTFALGGEAQPSTRPPFVKVTAVADPGFEPDESLASRGLAIFADLSCLACHGSGAVSGGAAPDLRASSIPLDREAFRAVVRDGALKDSGMPQWADMSEADLDALRQYIRTQTATLRQQQ